MKLSEALGQSPADVAADYRAALSSNVYQNLLRIPGVEDLTTKRQKANGTIALAYKHDGYTITNTLVARGNIQFRPSEDLKTSMKTGKTTSLTRVHHANRYVGGLLAVLSYIEKFAYARDTIDDKVKSYVARKVKEGASTGAVINVSRKGLATLKGLSADPMTGMYLNAADNHLTSLAGAPPGLDKLNVQNNDIKDVTGGPPELTTLYIGRNKLTDLAHVVKALPKLKTLSISGNKIKTGIVEAFLKVDNLYWSDGPHAVERYAENLKKMPKKEAILKLQQDLIDAGYDV